MSVPTGIGNYPPGVTDADPHFESEEREPSCEQVSSQGDPSHIVNEFKAALEEQRL